MIYFLCALDVQLLREAKHNAPSVLLIKNIDSVWNSFNISLKQCLNNELSSLNAPTLLLASSHVPYRRLSYEVSENCSA